MANNGKAWLDTDNAPESEALPVGDSQEWEPVDVAALRSAAGVATPAESEAIALSTFMGLAGEFSWLGPLLHAAASNPQAGVEPEARLITPWGGSPTVKEPDEAKHAAFCEQVKQQMQALAPWLLPMLSAANAVVYVGAGIFEFSVPDRAAFFRIPQLENMTRLVPWVDPGEVAH